MADVAELEGLVALHSIAVFSLMEDTTWKNGGIYDAVVLFFVVYQKEKITQ